MKLVIQACQALVEEGKQPSTAMVKSYLLRSGNAVPLAQIIRGIRAYTEGQRSTNAPAEKSVEDTPVDNLGAHMCSCKEELSELAKQVKALQVEIRDLQAQVEALKSA
jgi:predicted RNase H-like nuclease (RuvC/YqgF family)